MDNQHVNYFPIAKILWLQVHTPEVYAKAVKFVGWHEFAVWRLCGEPVIDYSLAECTGLFDIETREWSRELQDEIDVDVDLMPRFEIVNI